MNVVTTRYAQEIKEAFVFLKIGNIFPILV